MMYSKLPNVGISIFSKMSQLANEYKAINLAQGFPDYNPPELLIELLYKATKGGNNQYAPMPGNIKLRENISNHLFKKYKIAINPDTEICITAGATQAIYTAISTIISTGDKVAIFEPAYDSYTPAIEVNGGIPVYIKLNESDFSIPWGELEKAIKEKKIKAIIINNPHNPSGKIWKDEDYLRLKQIIASEHIFLIWDEVYDGMVYDAHEHISALQFKESFPNSFVCFSFGKSMHATGWKIGYIVSNENLMKEFKKVHQFTVFSVNTPAQVALAEFLEQEKNFIASLKTFYQDKRDYFIKNLQSSYFEFLPCEGSYFVLAKYNKIMQVDDQSFCLHLIKEHGIASVPVSAFYNDNTDHRLIRFCFAKKKETLDAAIEKLIRV